MGREPPMQIAHGFQAFQPPGEGVVLSIGNFDGVHAGHRAIVSEMRRIAAPLRARTLVITFDPHPLAALAPERAPAILTTAGERLALLSACGVEHGLILRADAALLNLTAEEFLERLVKFCRPRAIVEGPDFNFGRARGGSIETIQQHAGEHGYAVHVLATVHEPHLASQPRVSSSSIRQALADGRLADANAMLGRPYRIAGVVGVGDQRGRILGYPTANLDQCPHMLPQEAVYAAAAQLDDGRLHLAAVNIGPQPTFGGTRSRVEAFLLDYSGETLVGRRFGLHFLERLRPQQRFENAEALTRQIAADVAAVGRHAAALPVLRSSLIDLPS